MNKAFLYNTEKKGTQWRYFHLYGTYVHNFNVCAANGLHWNQSLLMTVVFEMVHLVQITTGYSFETMP